MRVQDKRTHYEICDLFQWANRDEFWKDNILSPSSLRKQWDQLTTKRLRATGTAKPSRGSIDLHNTDREQARRGAHNMPEQYTEREQMQQVAQIINGLFVQLAAAFPASLVNRSQEDVNEIRRQ